jgi:hypothetical protein
MEVSPMPDDPRRNTETPTIKANKSSAMRWAIGIAILFIVGVIAWWISDPRGEPAELTPQNQSEQNQPGYESLEGEQQTPPAVVPNQDTGGSPPATPEPAGPGTQ